MPGPHRNGPAAEITAVCVACGAGRPDQGVLYTCPHCGGNLDLIPDYDQWRRSAGLPDPLPGDGVGTEPQTGSLAPAEELPALRKMAAVTRLAPLRKINAGWFNSGDTPLLPARRLGFELGAHHIFLKDETRNLSGSLKDRASEMVIMRAMELGLSTIATASTGNAAASLAALAARCGLNAVIFAPRSAPPAKLRQIQVHGARLFLVDGNYDLAFDLCLEAVARKGWYSRNTGHNPYCCEGKKSVSIEIVRQMGWDPPDYIFVPVGDGCIIAGVHKGLIDLLKLGCIDRMPKLVAVQAEGSSAIADAWAENREIRPVVACTVADSVAVDLPRDGLKALRAIRETDGFAIKVSDGEILGAISHLARLEGLFAEPAGAVATAGLRLAVTGGLVDPGARIVSLVTGTGLKDPEALAGTLTEPPVITSIKELP